VIELELHGLELHGYHGVLPEERERGQRFVFDVTLLVGEPAADDVAFAVDYRDVARTVRDVSDSTKYALIESLAGAVAEALLERFAVEEARVRVRKPDVELDPPVEYAAATASRSRR
jgi:dihydroneopterin aldolase